MYFAASDEGGGGKQGRDLQAGGSRPDRTLPQSVVLQRCSFLQQSESTSSKVSDYTHFIPFPFLSMKIVLSSSYVKEKHSFTLFVVLFQYEIAIVTEDGVEIIGPLSSETNWDIAHMVR